MTGLRVFLVTCLLVTMVAAKRQAETGPATTMAPAPTGPAATGPAGTGPMTPGPAPTGPMTPGPAPSTKDQGRVLQEVKFEGGKAGASSKWSPGKNPEKAFTINTDYWSGGRNKHGRGDEVPFPYFVWYDFGNRTIVPARVGIRGWFQPVDTGYGPTMWEFIGSNDEECGKYSRWTILCSDLSDKKFQRKYQVKYCDVDQQITSSFRCLGISILNHSHKDYPEAVISIIRIWKNANPQ